jgi:hypothetical protein
MAIREGLWTMFRGLFFAQTESDKGKCNGNETKFHNLYYIMAYMDGCHRYDADCGYNAVGGGYF